MPEKLYAPDNYRFLAVCLLLLVVLSACLPIRSLPPTPVSSTTPGVKASPITPDWYTIFFTDPLAPSNNTYRGGPDADLAAAIHRSKASVDVAVLQLNLWSVRDALLDAHHRGVRVRMVIDDKYRHEKEVEALIKAGIPVVSNQGPGTMHNKFVVIDQLEVWTGSMNFTVSEAYRNNNTLIRIRSQSLAQNYTVEFEEMFQEKRFGADSPANTPNPVITIGDTLIEVCFSPEDGCIERLVDLVNSAHEMIVFLAFSFTSDELAEALIDSKDRGVLIRGVMEADQVASNKGGDYERLKQAGIEVHLDLNPYQMHEKVIVIDGKIVAVGSFNFTHSAATRNDENLLIFHNTEIAERYLEEFERLNTPAR